MCVRCGVEGILEWAHPGGVGVPMCLRGLGEGVEGGRDAFHMMGSNCLVQHPYHSEFLLTTACLKSFPAVQLVPYLLPPSVHALSRCMPPLSQHILPLL